MKCILEEFARADLEKEAIFRTLVSSYTAGNRKDRERSAITSVVDEVAATCFPLLELSNRQSAFREDLQRLSLDVVEFWTRAQKSRRRIIAVYKADEGVAAWECDGRYGKVIEDAHHAAVEVPVAICFPQIYQQLSTEVYVVHPGVALWSDQEEYAAGCKEFQAQLRRIKSQPSAPSDSGKRRQSTGGHRARNSMRRPTA